MDELHEGYNYHFFNVLIVINFVINLICKVSIITSFVIMVQRREIICTQSIQ